MQNNRVREVHELYTCLWCFQRKKRNGTYANIYLAVLNSTMFRSHCLLLNVPYPYNVMSSGDTSPPPQPRPQTAVLFGRRFFFCATTHLRPPTVARGINMMHYCEYFLDPRRYHRHLRSQHYFCPSFSLLQREGEGGAYFRMLVVPSDDKIRYDTIITTSCRFR